MAQRFLVEPAGATRLLAGAEPVTYVDVDSLLRRVYGKAKQGAGSGTPRSAVTRCCCAGCHR